MVIYALGGSTNAALHILAIAAEAGVPFTIDDFGRIGKQIPLLANMRPHGRYDITHVFFFKL